MCSCTLAAVHTFLVALCLCSSTGRALRVGSGGADPVAPQAIPSPFPRRVALILRGETFRGGRSNGHFIVKPEWAGIQKSNWQNHVELVVKPFEQDGYEVDIFAVHYKTDYDSMLSEELGSRLRVLETLEWAANTTQATNAAKAFGIFVEYMQRTGKQYRFAVFMRHDTRFLANMRDVILNRELPDEKVMLYTKKDIIPGKHHSADDRCSDDAHFVWNVKDRTSIKWWSCDRIQIVPGKHVNGFYQLLTGPLLVGPPRGSPFGHLARAPRWPFECWAELMPLVGGDEHIDFMKEEVLTVCKAFEEHSTERLSVRHIPNCELSAR